MALRVSPVDALDVRCPRCGRRATFDEPFEFHAKPPTDAAADGRPVHRWGGWFVRERFPALCPWRPPRGSEQRLVWGEAQRRPGGYGLYHRGVVRCTECHLVARHRLAWPGDAYFQWDVRGTRLWAEDAERARALLHYIESARRDPWAYKGYGRSLQNLPRAVLAARNRELVARRIRQSLHEAALSDAAPALRHPTGWPGYVTRGRPVRRSG